MLERLYTALGAADALRLRDMMFTSLTGLGVVGSLGDVRRRVDVPVMSDVA
mgnify:CR=1 FL=1